MNIKSPLTRAEAVKTAVILQSNYVPWRGYFDLIREADIFIYYDEVQYTRRDWRNRNIIITPQGRHWLTIPVEQSGKYYQSIAETKIADAGWARKHWTTLSTVYAKTPGFKKWAPLVKNLYEKVGDKHFLTDVNRVFIEGLSEALDIKTQFLCSSELPVQGDKTERLVALCNAVGADRYLSGPSAKSYVDEPVFERNGIELAWKTYPEYTSYKQLDGDYRPGVSMLDTLFCAGDLRSAEIISHVA